MRHAYVRACFCVYLCLRVFACAHADVCVCVCVCARARMCMRVCVFLNHNLYLSHVVDYHQGDSLYMCLVRRVWVASPAVTRFNENVVKTNQYTLSGVKVLTRPKNSLLCDIYRLHSLLQSGGRAKSVFAKIQTIRRLFNR